MGWWWWWGLRGCPYVFCVVVLLWECMVASQGSAAAAGACRAERRARPLSRVQLPLLLQPGTPTAK